ncbi:NADH:flavin oxidoreductase [uncultured Cetobacterium sp.]|uniref:NADH:flavin oxidoreductase n=1 Tax=uncultured Cetobacterium sp. TaxID=527638 RepID=UPI00260B72D5|nr:NADH:flavin oxidoreductase [uncultured Cetobacterium sp.]
MIIYFIKHIGKRGKIVNLFTPLRIKNIEIKNRVVLPPLVRFSMVGKDGKVTKELEQWYEDVAEGGVGLIIVEASCVAEDGKLRENQIGIWNDSFIEGLKKISSIGKKYKVPMLIQIHHAGFKDGIASVDENVLDRILEQFIEAFKRAKLAGFDGVEIHGAHTYLISQLNSRLWNIRTDKYGGTFEKRMFFTKELIERTRDLFNENFILGYRMGGNEPTLQDGIKIAKYLEKIGVDLIHISSGVPDPEKKQVEKVDKPKDFNYDWIVYMGCEIKKEVNIPIIGVKNIKTEEQASYLIENKMLDLVAVGRAMIARPNWVKYAEKNYKKRMEK